MIGASIYSCYVVEAGGDDIVIRGSPGRQFDDLVALGFSITSEDVVRMTVASVQEKAEILSKIRDIGLAFSIGPGWSPSAVFEELRDRKLIHGKYRRISWDGPGKPVVDEQ